MRLLREGIVIGPLFFHFYGLIIVIGILVGVWVASLCGKKRGLKKDVYWDMLPWMLIFGIIGARLWHVLLPSSSSGISFSWYLQHPAKILAVWEGGLGIPGAVIGGVFGVWLFCRKNKVSFIELVDTIGVGLPLGQAIGRWGNYVNQELYGKPSTLPWAITIDAAHRPAGYENIATYHPLFLYESIYNLIVFAILWKIDHSKKIHLKPGSVFLLYLVLYPVGRFFLEFLRLDTVQMGGLNMNQTIMGITAVVSAIALIIREKKAK